MKAAVVSAAGKTPLYADFKMPSAAEGQELIAVQASALSPFSRSRATGAHYSADNAFPAVAGSDGVGTTEDGRRVYFVLPEAPFGSLAEFSVVRSEQCVELPGELDAVTAAAIANPGMSAWASLVGRAHLVRGETVLINGATGSAGRLAVQLAMYLGASRIIATGRNAEELERMKKVGVDVAIPFTLGILHPNGTKEFELALKEAFARGIDVVIDYLWGESAKTIMIAIAKAAKDERPVRFVHVGEAGGEGTIELPGAALRSSGMVLMGSGVKSLRLSVLLEAVRSVFALVEPAGLKIDTRVVPLSEVGETWEKATGKPRVVYTIP